MWWHLAIPLHSRDQFPASSLTLLSFTCIKNWHTLLCWPNALHFVKRHVDPSLESGEFVYTRIAQSQHRKNAFQGQRMIWNRQRNRLKQSHIWTIFDLPLIISSRQKSIHNRLMKGVNNFKIKFCRLYVVHQSFVVPFSLDGQMAINHSPRSFWVMPENLVL